MPTRKLTQRKNFQRRSDPIRLLAESHEKQLKREFTQALTHLKSLVPVSEIEDAMRNGKSVDAIIKAINFHHYGEILKQPASVLGSIFEQAGKHGGKQLANQMSRKGVRLRYRKDIGDGFDFNRFDQATQEKLREIISGLIGDLSDQAKETISNIVLNGVKSGQSFFRIASDIRDTITLTANQAQAVVSYRNALENLDGNALQRALRSSVHDATIQDAIDSGEQLSSDVIDQAVNDYLQNYLDHRAGTIARTESLRAGNAGLRDSYRQAAERGVIPSAAVTRVWLLDLDERTCPICKSIVDNNPDGVGLNDDFDSDDGPIDDAPVHPNCRCTVQYETDLDQVPDDSDQGE